MRLRAFAALWFFLPLGCTDDAPEPPKNVLNKPISFYTSCYGNIMFTNNTLDNFVITKIMRENKMRDASLIIENKKVWEYRGHPNGQNASALSDRTLRILVLKKTSKVRWLVNYLLERSIL